MFPSEGGVETLFRGNLLITAIFLVVLLVGANIFLIN